MRNFQENDKMKALWQKVAYGAREDSTGSICQIAVCWCMIIEHAVRTMEATACAADHHLAASCVMDTRLAKCYVMP